MESEKKVYVTPIVTHIGHFCVQCYLEEKKIVEPVDKDSKKRPACDKHKVT